jgi:hypothetical protein
MSSESARNSKPQPANTNVRMRPCLKCSTPFQSEWAGERICRHCKGSSTWRNSSLAGTGESRAR